MKSPTNASEVGATCLKGSVSIPQENTCCSCIVAEYEVQLSIAICIYCIRGICEDAGGKRTRSSKGSVAISQENPAVKIDQIGKSVVVQVGGFDGRCSKR